MALLDWRWPYKKIKRLRLDVWEAGWMLWDHVLDTFREALEV